jgi:hypothetical protein
VISAAVLGGLFIGVLSALPIVNVANCCCLWIIGGGVLAAYLVQQGDPRPITVGRGAIAGVTAGVIGAFVWLFVSIALNPFMAPLQERLVDTMIRNAQDMPPDVRELIDMTANRASSPLRYAVGVAFHLFAGLIFATLGGILGAVFYRRQDESPGDVVPPPLPPDAS